MDHCDMISLKKIQACIVYQIGLTKNIPVRMVDVDQNESGLCK
jgi:hypothetical protein